MTSEDEMYSDLTWTVEMLMGPGHWTDDCFDELTWLLTEGLRPRG